MNNAKSGERLRRMTGIAIFSAIVVVLTLLGAFIRFGLFSITLSIAPIIIGAAVYGSTAGAFLGAVMGATVLINGIATGDFAIMALMSASPFACIFVCLLKSTAAGFFGGLMYKLTAKKNEHLGVAAAGVVCPVVNTGIFVLGMLIFFEDTLTAWAGGQAMLSYVIFGLTGVNFLIELAVNLVLSSGITEIIRYSGRRKAE